MWPAAQLSMTGHCPTFSSNAPAVLQAPAMLLICPCPTWQLDPHICHSIWDAQISMRGPVPPLHAGHPWTRSHSMQSRPSPPACPHHAPGRPSTLLHTLRLQKYSCQHADQWPPGEVMQSITMYMLQSKEHGQMRMTACRLSPAMSI